MYGYQVMRPGFHFPVYHGGAKIIEVTGKGTVYGEPDVAVIVLGVLTEDSQLQTAQQENGKTFGQVLDALLASGVERKDIQTVEYRIDRLYDFTGGKQLFRAYEVRHLVEIKQVDVEKAGSIIDSAVQAGANILSNIRFDVSNREALYKEALTMAINNAEKKAETIAVAAGSPVKPNPFMMKEFHEKKPVPYGVTSFEQVASSTPIQAGENVIEAFVIIRYAFL